jgi:iron complex outermembrane receptor protein
MGRENMVARGLFCFLSTAVFLTTSTLASAQETPAAPPEEAKVLRLFYDAGALVTTATRTPEEARLAPSTVEVFTSEDIENMGATKLSDLLRTLESVYISTQTNSRESIWIRGIRNRYNDKVLLLVDGIPRRDPVYEHASVDEYLPLTNVERVEVIRGPGSALYGTNAFAGVINVITKIPKGDAWGKVEVGGGDYRTAQGAVDGAFTWGSAKFYGFVNGFRTDGDGPDYQRHHLEQYLRQNPKSQASGGITATAGDFTLRLERLHYFHIFTTDWDVPAWRWKDEGYWYDDTFASAVFSRNLSAAIRVEATAYYQDYQQTNFWRQWLWGQQGPRSTPADVSDEIDVTKSGSRSGGQLQFTFQTAPGNQLVAGASYEREAVSRVEDIWTTVASGNQTRPFFIDPVAVATWALFVEDTWKPATWVSVTAGARSDHNGLFGWKTSPRFGVTFHPGDRLVVKFLYGEAFRAPSFREFFTVDLTNSFPAGNRSLKPENIRTAEASVQYTFSSYLAGHLVVYHESTSNSIFSSDNRPYANQAGTVLNGVEAGVKMAWPNRITAYVNGSHCRTDLYNVPRTQFNGAINVPFWRGWNWSLLAHYVSSRPRDPEDKYSYDPGHPPYRRPDVSSYVLVDSTLRILELKRGLEIRLSVNNLLDRKYYDPIYEPTKYFDLQAPGRTFLVKAVYRF